MLVFIAKRIALMFLLIIGVTFITFLFSHVMAPDPARLWAGRHANAARIQAITVLYHLNQPVYTQYWYYLKGIFTGNFGYDPRTGAPILPQILGYFPATLELVLTSVVIMAVIGIPLGAVAASKNGRLTDHVIRVVYLIGWATPSFLGALLLILIFTFYLGVLPDQGAIGSSFIIPARTGLPVIDSLLAGNVEAFFSSLQHLLLPAASLAFLNFGIATRMTRATMLDVLPQDYVKAARSKGLTEYIVVYKHALRNAMISTVTVLTLLAGWLISGDVVVEVIFGWPGIGEYSYNAVITYNFPAIIGVTVVFSICIIVANLIADIMYAILDPKVEWG